MVLPQHCTNICTVVSVCKREVKQRRTPGSKRVAVLDVKKRLKLLQAPVVLMKLHLFGNDYLYA